VTVFFVRWAQIDLLTYLLTVFQFLAEPVLFSMNQLQGLRHLMPRLVTKESWTLRSRPGRRTRIFVLQDLARTNAR